MARQVDIVLSVFLFISASLDRVGQKNLAEYVSPTGANSIPAALESDTVAIDGVSEVTAVSFRNFGIEEVGVLGYYGGEFKVEVMSAGATLTEIMDGLDARLATITGLRHKAYLADQVNPPQAVVQVPDIDDYHLAFDG